MQRLGRNTDKDTYKIDMRRQAYELALLGANHKEISKVLGIGERTLTLWLSENAAFRESVNAGRTLADAKVAASLYKKAVGYEVEEDHVSVYRGTVTVTRIRKHIEPDVMACVKWLALRQKERWSESQKVQHNQTSINVQMNKFDFTDFTNAELKTLRKAGIIQLAQQNDAEDSQE